MTDTKGLNSILNHNETAQPNDDLLNTLKATIPQFFDKDGNFKIDKFEDELKKNNIAEARDGYKLGFVGKDYARLQVGLKSETMIVPDCKHNSLPVNTNSGNVFFTGDNIDALRHLVNAYKKKIKFIYIDPPYNTGEEFVYSDKFEFSDEKLKSILGYSNEEIARLKSIQGKSSHSAWLTFMYPRLKLAQELLKEDGVIFVSIDDNEQSNLKIIMDDVFGESNFVANIVWQKKYAATNDARGFSTTHDYIMCYQKSILFDRNLLPRTDEQNMPYKNDDKDGKGLWRSGDLLAKSFSRSCVYSIKNPNTGKDYYPPDGSCWRASQSTMQIWLAENRIFFGKDGNGAPQLKRYLIEVQQGKVPITWWTFEEVGHNDAANKEVAELFGTKTPFDTPKPSSLIKQMLRIGTNKTDLILDFFAGSATTAHAVMQLNAEDGGNRKFIMVQLDEKTNPDSEARKAGYNTIDEIARKRIDLSGKKILADYESDLVKQTNGWDKDIGFKHYRLVTPDVKTLEKIIEFDPKQTNLIADDMIKPFEYQKTETGGLDTILATWLIDDGYRFDTPVEEITFGNYKAHYVREAITLYLINMGWDTRALKDMLNQIGTNKLLVKTIVVYPYSFEFEAMRELKTNIKTNLDYSPNLIERY
jgi:adenine-specific DNA-methyltransferase